LVWACLAAAASGFVVGLRFKVTMLLPMVLVLLAGTVGVAIYAQWEPLHAVGVALLLVAIQQAFYLLGLSVVARR